MINQQAGSGSMKLKKHTSTPGCEVIGQSILAIISGSIDDGHELLEKYDMRDVKSDEWYPQQTLVDMLREMDDGWGNYFNLVSIGMEIANKAQIPANTKSLDEVYARLNRAYHKHNRNENPDRGWSFEKVDEDTFTIISTGVFPTNFKYGVLYGLTKRFAPPNRSFVLSVIEEDDFQTTFQVVLED